VTLLKAFLRARAAGLPLRWVVVGRPHYQGSAIVKRLRAAPGVDVRGWVSDGELERLYRGARLVACPRTTRASGWCRSRRWRRGVPTAVATSSALDETAGQAALGVNPGDVAGWADALGRLQSDEAVRADVVARGRERAARFTWERPPARTGGGPKRRISTPDTRPATSGAATMPPINATGEPVPSPALKLGLEPRELGDGALALEALREPPRRQPELRRRPP
jgi:hypothetical protein